MTKPRSQQISLEETPFYHCYSRCVRRAFLCGKDPVSSRNFEHRREILEERLFELSEIFTIDIIAYAIMSNHYHLVLRIDTETAKRLSNKELIERWFRLYNKKFQGYQLAKCYLMRESLNLKEKEALNAHIEQWRKNLSSLSWFMRNVNEYMARICNKEDNCTGHFWESRFKCKALLDKKALLSCMAYVDLNPIRACEAQSLETSEFTSVSKRIKDKEQVKNEQKMSQQESSSLYPFIGNEKTQDINGLNMYLADYLDLLNWSTKQIVPGKKGYVKETAPPILQELGIAQENWIYLMKNFDSAFKGIVGMYYRIKEACRSFGNTKNYNLNTARNLFGS